MANRLFIQDHIDPKISFSFPLTKDPMIEVESQFSSFAEVLPALSNILSKVTMASAGLTGEVSAGLLGTQNLFDIKRWTKTDPLRISVDLQLYTKNSSEKDVHQKAYDLINYVILSKDPVSNSFIVPGISLASLSDFSGAKSTSDKAKLVSIWIPGIIYVPLAIIEKVQPTFSKEITDAGFPLWAELNVTMESVFPANSDYFEKNNVQGGFGAYVGSWLTYGKAGFIE